MLSRILAYNGKKNGGVGSYLLPMAFPEGSPLHSSYGSGHATVGGELDKLASNVGIGRNISGVHWRSWSRPHLPRESPG